VPHIALERATEGAGQPTPALTADFVEAAQLDQVGLNAACTNLNPDGTCHHISVPILAEEIAAVSAPEARP